MQILQQPAKSTTDKTSNEESNLFNTNPMSINDYFKKKMNRTKPVETTESNGNGDAKKAEQRQDEAPAEEEDLVRTSKPKKAKKSKCEDLVDDSNNKNKSGDEKEGEEVVQSDSELG